MAGHWTSSAQQPSVPTLEQVPLLLSLLGSPAVPARIDELLHELNGSKGEPGANWHRRPVVGQHQGPASAARWSARYQTSQRDASVGAITTAHSGSAKAWEGWSTALKPCHEPILMCRKPFAGTLVNNVLKHSVGALNIDACRVGGDVMYPERSIGGRSTSQSRAMGSNTVRIPTGETQVGRWPGNVMHDGCLPEPMDRYFYCAKASRADRAAGVPGGEENAHPTVKPTMLMQWLCRLVTPPDGLILDPFTGSGSTGRAAALEGFRFLGFEVDEEYSRIARLRIAEAAACR